VNDGPVLEKTAQDLVEMGAKVNVVAVRKEIGGLIALDDFEHLDLEGFWLTIKTRLCGVTERGDWSSGARTISLWNRNGAFT